MKKIIILLLGVTIFIGCSKEDDFAPNVVEVSPDLMINKSIGIKLQSSFVTTEVSMNVKSEVSGPATIKILDLTNRVVSKEQVEIKTGDNILKVYTSALPPSAYRIGFYDVNGKQLGITDFNKIN